jgi:hypothetical protein
VEMSKVIKCDAGDCAYNTDNRCHATAITIGNADNPRCDTFCQAPTKGGNTSRTAGVGACKISYCIYNLNLGCGAPQISVGCKKHEPDCLTFQMK